MKRLIFESNHNFSILRSEKFSSPLTLWGEPFNDGTLEEIIYSRIKFRGCRVLQIPFTFDGLTIWEVSPLPSTIKLDNGYEFRIPLSYRLFELQSSGKLYRIVSESVSFETIRGFL